MLAGLLSRAILRFGRNLLATTGIVAILSFFPTMISTVAGMCLTRRLIVAPVSA